MQSGGHSTAPSDGVADSLDEAKGAFRGLRIRIVAWLREPARRNMKTGQVPCSAPTASGEIFGAPTFVTEDSPTTTFEIKRCAGFPTRPHKIGCPERRRGR